MTVISLTCLLYTSNVSDKPVFELKHLTLNGSFSDINLSLRRGEILGITGLLDSGRTELGLSMFGLKPADSGQIIKDGKEIKLTSPREADVYKRQPQIRRRMTHTKGGR